MFDKARVSWKSFAAKQSNSSATSNYLHQKYMDILARIQSKVLAAHTSFHTDMKQWDENYFITNHREPYEEDYRKDGQVYKTYKKLILCRDLLKHWKITLHM